MTCDDFLKSFERGIKPDSVISVSDWADANRVLSRTASSEPGRFRTSRTPYLKEVMDALSPSSPYEKVVFMKGAQIGGTEAGNNWIGYMIDQAPGPMLVVQPTVEMGKRWSKGRLAPLIEDTPCLRDKVKDPRTRDSGNTVQSKEFPGGQVVITGANSAVGLRSMPVKYLFLDEVDAYPPDADSEGDPLTLAIQRTATFTRRKIFIVSTPTIQGLSRIEKEFSETDQRYYFVPCPFCDGYQTLKWENIHYDQIDSKVSYVCEFCKEHIDERYKTEMLRKGEWRPQRQHDVASKSSLRKEESSPQQKNKTQPVHRQKGRTIGFHLSSLYSPVGWMSWETCYHNYESAKKDDQLLKAWTNTTLGLPWEEKGDVPDWGLLFDRRESYKIGRVPRGGYVLTAGVDVQNDRIELEIVAWGKDHENWSVDYRVIYGNPTTQAPWNKLSEILNEEFESEDGVYRKINMMAVDSGFATQHVYDWVRKQPIHNVMAVKGVDNSLVSLNAPTKVDVNKHGKKIANGVRLWKVGVSLLKSEFYGWLKPEAWRENLLRKEENKIQPAKTSHLSGGQISPAEALRPLGGQLPSAGSPCRCHFPEYNTEYFKQITAEQLVTKIVRGYPKREWKKIRDRNEALDCRIYARAAAIALGIDRWSDQKWQQIMELSNPEEKPKVTRRLKKIRSSFL